MAVKVLTQIKKHLFLCNGQSCKLRGGEESTIAIRTAIADQGISEAIHTTKTLCNGRCKDGPIVIAQPEGLWFKKMTKDKAVCFVQNFLVENTASPDDVLYKYGDDKVFPAKDNENYIEKNEAVNTAALFNHLDH
jgi:(2Fe-2S) ferredoxin